MRPARHGTDTYQQEFAEVNLRNGGHVRDAIVSDNAQRVMFVFRADYDAETYEQFTVPEARGENVGVTCLQRD